MDTQDSGSNGNNAQVYQIANPAANYGPSEFDTRNAFKGRVVYLLPVGMGRRFLSNSHILDLGLGGWQLAGTAVVMSGNPFTPVIDSPNNSYSLGGWWYPNVMGNPKLAHPSIQQWFNPAAFTSPADGTFGDMQRDSVYGPGMSEINLSAGKTFSIREGVNLLIRGDATNAPNHFSPGVPNYGLICSTPGVPCTGATNITTLAVPGRQMQLGARLSF